MLLDPCPFHTHAEVAMLHKWGHFVDLQWEKSSGEINGPARDSRIGPLKAAGVIGALT